MKGSGLHPIARGWQIGSALLLVAVAGQAWAGTISGKVTAPSGVDLTSSGSEGAKVFATSDKFKVYSVDVGDDGTYTLDNVDNGTYTVAVRGRGLSAEDVKNVVISDANPKATENFDLKTPTPFCIVKSPNPISLDDGIDSAAFQDAPEIDLNSGANVETGDATTWGGPNTVSGRFKMKYSSAGLHLAGDVTYATPGVNNQTDGNIWNGNAIEIDFQNDKYDVTRTAYDNDHNWQIGLSLGSTPSWWLWGGVNAAPAVNGTAEDVNKHFKMLKKTDHEQSFRLDIPWNILLDSNGKPISAPADKDLGAMDIALDAADPKADRTTADRSTGYQLAWSRYSDTYKNPSSEAPIQFCPQAPAPAAAPAPTAGP